MYTCQVTAYFVSHFVAIATRDGCGRIRLASFNSPPQPFVERNDLGDISYKIQVIAHFVPNFVAVATRVGEGGKI